MSTYTARQKIGFPLGLAIFTLLLFVPAPAGLSQAGLRTAAIAVLMAVWWLTEALPLAAVSMVPLAAFPLLGVLSPKEVSARYGDPNIFLFMGGFMIAMAMQKWGLHRRIALRVLLLVGGGPTRLLAGMMIATGLVSMWVSNTATAVMMLPIAIAVVEQLGGRERAGRTGEAFMLGVAYASSIGGLATLVGTPPNLIFVGQAAALFPELPTVSFVQWFVFAFPLSVGLLVFAWAWLSFVCLRSETGSSTTKALLRKELAALGPPSRGEIGTFLIFACTALAWIGRSDIALGETTIPGWTTLLNLPEVHDGTIAMLATLLLFATPTRMKDPEFLLDWDSAVRIPWGVLLLFGGGFALAEGVRISGLDRWLGSGFAGLSGMSPILMVALVCLAVTFLTEVTSNTASATMLMPVLAAAAGVLDVHPYLLMIPATISASCAFMLPAATPPNAVVFGSGYVTIPQMARAGLALNLFGVIWVTLMMWTLGQAAFGFSG